MYEIVTFYTLNLHNVICQLYLNKREGGNKTQLHTAYKEHTSKIKTHAEKVAKMEE